MGVIDPKMDMTKDMDFIKGSRGITYWFTEIRDIPRDLFKKYVRGKNFLDIGAGDGRVLRLAVSCGAKKSRGSEIDKKFVESSSMQRWIKICDFKEVDPKNFDVIYYFLGSTQEVLTGRDGEPEVIEYLKNFEGTLILYHRKVGHRLQKFEDNLKSEGFEKVEGKGFLIVYRRGQK